jgi:hypothetical protein
MLHKNNARAARPVEKYLVRQHIVQKHIVDLLVLIPSCVEKRIVDLEVGACAVRLNTAGQQDEV